MPRLTQEIIHNYAWHRGYTFGGRLGNYYLRPDDGLTCTWILSDLREVARFLAGRPVVRTYLKRAA